MKHRLLNALAKIETERKLAELHYLKSTIEKIETRHGRARSYKYDDNLNEAVELIAKARLLIGLAFTAHEKEYGSSDSAAYYMKNAMRYLGDASDFCKVSVTQIKRKKKP